MEVKKVCSERDECREQQHRERVEKFLDAVDARTLGSMNPWALCYFCDANIGLRKMLPRNIRYDKSAHICSSCRRGKADELVLSGGLQVD